MAWVIPTSFWGRHELYDVKLYKDKTWHFSFCNTKMSETTYVMKSGKHAVISQHYITTLGNIDLRCPARVQSKWYTLHVVVC